MQVVGTKRADLNGCAARLYSFDPQSGRYTACVAVQGSQGSASREVSIALKPANIALPAGACVRIADIQSQPQLNGQLCSVSTFDEKAGRYVLKVPGGKPVRVKLTNAIAAHM